MLFTIPRFTFRMDNCTGSVRQILLRLATPNVLARTA